MATHKLHKRVPLAACTATKASKLCKERAELDELRLELNRESDSLVKKIAAIDDELMRFVEANRSGKEPVVELAKHRLEIIQTAGFFSYKDNLIREIGFDEFERRKSEVPTKPKLQLTEKLPTRSTRTKPSPGASKGRAA